MAPLTVVLCVVVALQPMLAASVQNEDTVTKSPNKMAKEMISGYDPGWFKRDVISDDDADELHRALQIWQQYLRSLGKQKAAQATALGMEVGKRDSDEESKKKTAIATAQGRNVGKPPRKKYLFLEKMAKDMISGYYPGWFKRDVISDDDADELHRALQMWLKYFRSLRMEQGAMNTVAGLVVDESMQRKRDIISSEDEDKVLCALQMLEEYLHSMNSRRTARRRRNMMTNEDEDGNQSPWGGVQDDLQELSELVELLHRSIGTEGNVVMALRRRMEETARVQKGKQKTAEATALGKEVRKRATDKASKKKTAVATAQRKKVGKLPGTKYPPLESKKKTAVATAQRKKVGKLPGTKYPPLEVKAQQLMRGRYRHGHRGSVKRDVISGDDVDVLHRAWQVWLQYLRFLGKQKAAQATALGMEVWKRDSDEEIITEGTAWRYQVERRSVISREDEDDILSALDQLEEYLEMQRQRERATNMMAGNPGSLLQETDWDDIVEEKRGSLGQQQETSLAPTPTKAEDVCQELQRLGRGPGQRALLPFPLMQRLFLRLDENQDGYLDERELSKFMEIFEELKICMARAV